MAKFSDEVGLVIRVKGVEELRAALARHDVDDLARQRAKRAVRRLAKEWRAP